MNDQYGLGWTLAAYIVHNEARRADEEKFQAERDRRYAEVKSAEEKALRVKDEADKAALGLAREIQTYKDEKANELREQINRERGDYATKLDLMATVEKMEATLTPLARSVAEHQAAQSSGSKGMRDMWQWIIVAAVAGMELYRILGPQN